MASRFGSNFSTNLTTNPADFNIFWPNRGLMVNALELTWAWSELAVTVEVRYCDADRSLGR
jgi:hypothetical protein